MNPLAQSGWANAIPDQANHEIVGDQFTPLHDALRLLSEFAPGGHGSPQHVAGRELDQAPFLLQPLRLGPLAGPRRSEKNDVHRPLPRSRPS